jgi:hypothetical protein
VPIDRPTGGWDRYRSCRCREGTDVVGGVGWLPWNGGLDVTTREAPSLEVVAAAVHIVRLRAGYQV